MKESNEKIILRVLFSLLGAGLGVAAMMGTVQVCRMVQEKINIPVYALVLSYIGSGLLFGTVFALLSSRLADKTMAIIKRCEERISSMSLTELLSSMTGLIIGLVIAVLIIQVLRFMGNSMFLVMLSSIIFVVLGSVGFSVGLGKSAEMAGLMKGFGKGSSKKFRTKSGTSASHSSKKFLLDSSAIIDGRAAALTHMGVLSQGVMVPSFVMDELKAMSLSADISKADRGKRAADAAEEMISKHLWRQLNCKDELPSREESLALSARQHNAKIVTASQSMTEVCAARRISCINLNELAERMRQSLSSGDVLTLTVVKKGKDPSQGVGYLDDGTMVVISGAADFTGRQVTCTVTSTIATTAGRMVFAEKNK